MYRNNNINNAKNTLCKQNKYIYWKIYSSHEDLPWLKRILETFKYSHYNRNRFIALGPNRNKNLISFFRHSQGKNHLLWKKKILQWKKKHSCNTKKISQESLALQRNDKNLYGSNENKNSHYTECLTKNTPLLGDYHLWQDHLNWC